MWKHLETIFFLLKIKKNHYELLQTFWIQNSNIYTKDFAFILV